MKYIKDNYRLIFQTVALHSYLLLLLYFYDGDRHLSHYLLILGFGIFLDFLLQKIFLKKVSFNMSVLITSVACYMLLTTKHVIWPYFVAVGVGVLSKYIIRVNNAHVFNPANIGVLFCICAFSNFVMMNPGQWLGSSSSMFLFAILGFAVAFVANRWVLSVTYILALVVLRLVKYEMTGINLSFLLGPALSGAGFIMAFHMITDPRTSPNDKSGQFVFGLFVAGLDFYFREIQIIFAPVLSLSIACALRANMELLLSPIKHLLAPFKKSSKQTV